MKSRRKNMVRKRTLVALFCFGAAVGLKLVGVAGLIAILALLFFMIDLYDFVMEDAK